MAASQKKKTMKLQTRLAITEDDTKVLGRPTSLRRDKTVTDEKFHTLKMKTQKSAWTPMVNKTSNEQLFKERRDLVSHWFDLWSDSQRKRFLDVIFQQCTRSQYRFVQKYFNDKVPMQHLDMTVVLPRFLSLYIFSFLEPKSLCRAAQVSWHWKFLTEQEAVWMPKCVRLGWFLPYTPADNEYGAWKRHYVACIHTLDYQMTRGRAGSVDRGVDRRHKHAKSPLKTGRLSRTDSRRLMDIRPPWQGPNLKPKDLVKSQLACLTDQNPNDPVRPRSDLVLHDKFGLRRATPDKTLSTKSLDFEIGTDTDHRKDRHRMLVAGQDYDVSRANRATLRDELVAVNREEKRLRDLINTDWMPPTASVMKSFRLAPAHSKKTIQIGGSFTSVNPRVVIISSRVPGAELLLDAVLFGVLPVVYEYEGTTAQSIVQQVEAVLEGRNAQSIGLFCHCHEPSELRLCHGVTVTLDSLTDEEDEESREFFDALTNHILPVDMGGQFDIFVPLASSEEGMEMMVQLSVLTSMQFSAPTGLIGSYNHVNSEWLIPYEDNLQPPSVYFCDSKLSVWANVAEQAQEAVRETRGFMDGYFDRLHRNISAQLTGQLVFDVLGQTDVQGVQTVTDGIRDALVALGDSDTKHPLKFLGRFLLEKSGVSTDGMALTTKRSLSLSQELAQSEAADDLASDVDQSQGPLKSARDNEAGDEEDEEEENEERGDRADVQGQEENEENLKDSMSEKESRQLRGRQDSARRTMDLSAKFGTIRANRTQRLTPEQFAEHPEKRTPVAFEIVSSETEYLRLLRSVQDVYVKPLKSALASNRSIISAQNIQIIFSDIMNIYKVSKELEEELRSRLYDWEPQHSCLGDIFVRLCSKVKVYTNFTNNYEVILRAVERCKEQTPAFRAFLQRHERVPETRMLMLQEIFLLPVRRVSEYVHLLTWFERHTPRTHADRQDLAQAINTLTELDRGMQESKVRMEREKQLVALTKRIINCPALLEANRYLIQHVDVAHLRPPTDSQVPEYRAFQEIAMLGLYLFNDALVVTRRTAKHFPFSRAIEFNYKYETSMSLLRMKLVDIPDSKYVKNAFRVDTPKQSWTLATVTADDKFNWVSILERTLRGAIDRK
ncbi:epithelial cell-transforming sequence 2 oncogene-like [Aplysia californica]|uniref:Epithelial cell-transforming sequence 2 oncogene-like n=1 Tax=Aplysia californica TaxID=6500 RepID=A0ABM1VQ57_APLCA|nr:epithelial cell-transforming sequence 2 oncogene-like [Aplysia californica]